MTTERPAFCFSDSPFSFSVSMLFYFLIVLWSRMRSKYHFSFFLCITQFLFPGNWLPGQNNNNNNNNYVVAVNKPVKLWECVICPFMSFLSRITAGRINWTIIASSAGRVNGNVLCSSLPIRSSRPNPDLHVFWSFSHALEPYVTGQLLSDITVIRVTT